MSGIGAQLLPCLLCLRHIRVSEPACPFCGALSGVGRSALLALSLSSALACEGPPAPPSSLPAPAAAAPATRMLDPSEAPETSIVEREPPGTRRTLGARDTPALGLLSSSGVYGAPPVPKPFRSSDLRTWIAARCHRSDGSLVPCEVGVADGIFLEGDAARVFEDVVSMMTLDAAGHTPPGAHVSGRVTLAPEELRVVIRDQGTTLSAEDVRDFLEIMPGLVAQPRWRDAPRPPPRLARVLKRRLQALGGDLTVSTPKDTGVQYEATLPRSAFEHKAP